MIGMIAGDLSRARRIRRWVNAVIPNDKIRSATSGLLIITCGFNLRSKLNWIRTLTILVCFGLGLSDLATAIV